MDIYWFHQGRHVWHPEKPHCPPTSLMETLVKGCPSHVGLPSFTVPEQWPGLAKSHQKEDTWVPCLQADFSSFPWLWDPYRLHWSSLSAFTDSWLLCQSLASCCQRGASAEAGNSPDLPCGLPSHCLLWQWLITVFLESSHAARGMWIACPALSSCCAWMCSACAWHQPLSSHFYQPPEAHPHQEPAVQVHPPTQALLLSPFSSQLSHHAN